MKMHRLIPIAITILIFAGCSGKQSGEKKVETAATTQSKIISPEEAAVRASLIELFDRIKEGDKTVLYENEFSYLKDTISLSAYLELKRVRDYKYDTLKGIEIDSISITGDSARAYIRINYQSQEGVEHSKPYRLGLYRSGINWIKPYLSRWAEERDYLEQRRIYDSLTAGH